MHVVIVGGGLVGLAIALGLQKRGISYVVLEAWTSRDRNWAVTISWSGHQLKELLPPELFDRLPECYPDPAWATREEKDERILVKDGSNGQLIWAVPPYAGIFRLNIQKTRKMWAQHVNIKYGKRVEAIEVTTTGPAAVMDDGTREHGTIVIGADGSRSFVRRWLLGDQAEPEYLSAQMINTTVQYTAERAAFIESSIHPVVDIAIHPKSMYMGVLLLDKPDPTRPESWSFYLLASWPDWQEDRGNETQLDKFRRLASDWVEPYKSAAAWIPDDVSVRREWVKIWSPKRWDNHDGQVTIVGDAAHSMTWHRGQGANIGFADAANTVQALEKISKGEASLKESIDALDKIVRERGAKEVQVSKNQTHSSHTHAEYLKSPVIKMGLLPNKDDSWPREPKREDVIGPLHQQEAG